MTEIEILKPIVQIGNARFDILVKEGFYVPAGSDFPRFHCHPDYEVHCIERGTFYYQLEDGLHIFKGPCILVFPPQVYHSFESMSPDGEKCCFEFDLFANGPGHSFFEYSSLLSGLTRQEAFSVSFPGLSIFKEQKKDEETEFRMKAVLGEVLITLFTAMRGSVSRGSGLSKTKPKKADQTLLLTGIIKYIEKNYQRELTLSEVASAVHLSERQVERVLKEGMQEGFLTLLNRYRIRMAVVRLLNGERDLAALSDSLGFQSYATFWKHFTKFNGVSPSVFLKTTQEK